MFNELIGRKSEKNVISPQISIASMEVLLEQAQ